MKKIELMRKYFGNGPEGKKCKECVNCVKVRQADRQYRKCEVYGVTGSESSDWAGRWDACGHFGKEPEEGDIPVIKWKKNGTRKNEQLDGQTSML